MKLLIIIPAYNEAENIERVVSDLINNYPQYDYVVVNDGSLDDTAKICKSNSYNLLNLPVNLGLAGCFQTGMKYAYKHDYDYALQFDGDGQHNPEYIRLLLDEIKEKDLDFVIGSRFADRKKQKSLRMLGNSLIQLCLKVTTGKAVKDPTSGMRLFNKRLIKILANSLDFAPEPDTLAFLIRQGAKFGEIQVEMNARIAGESYLNLTNSVKYMFRILTSITLMQWFRKKSKF